MQGVINVPGNRGNEEIGENEKRTPFLAVRLCLRKTKTKTKKQTMQVINVSGNRENENESNILNSIQRCKTRD